MNDISFIKIQYSKKYDTSIIAGDINFDDNRYTGHTQAINNYLLEKGLSSIWEYIPGDFTFAAGSSFSTIDHFFIPSNQTNMVVEAGSIHDSENLSGHCPIFVKLNLKKASKPQEDIVKKPRLNWNNSSTQQRNNYSSKVQEKLQQNDDHLLCNNVSCENFHHQCYIDQYTSNLLKS